MRAQKLAPSSIQSWLRPISLGLGLLATSLAVHAAESGPALGVVGAASMQNPVISKNTSSGSVSGSTAWGAGVTGEIVVALGFVLEADLLYLGRKFSQNSADIFGTTVSSTFSSGYIHIPVMLRYRPIDMINIGAGLYYNRVVSAWNVSAAGHSDTTTDFGKNDFGLVLGLGTMLPVSDTLSIVADLRYARSLSDTARSSGDALKFSDFQILAGVRFGIR